MNRIKILSNLALSALLSQVPMYAVVAADAAPPAATRPPDEIGGPMTKEMKGLHLLYKYTSGREYQLDFDADTVTFLLHHDPQAKPGEVFTSATMHYMARKIRPQLYLVHWLNRSPDMGNIHVALIVDLKNRLMYASAIMPRGFELFDVAHVEELSWKKDAG